MRKKGTLGSLSSVRPSLKLDFGSRDINEGRTLRGERYVTLNNNHQSPGVIEQCLAYYVFRKAGIAAPKCNFSKVKSQGNDLGVYSHIEDVKAPLLKRHFENSTGNLYEGNVSDFHQNLVGRFQKKNTNTQSDRSDLDLVVSALDGDHSDFYSALDVHIDMDEFLTFAALEALLGHSDSYTGGQSNYYIYRDLEDDRFHFIPWGVDQTFEDRLDSNFPKSVFLGSRIMDRAWAQADFRQRYDVRMQQILNEVWDEAELKALADDYQALTGANPTFVSNIKSFIDNQRAIITAELGDDTRSWPRSIREEVPISETAQCETLESITGEFEGVTNGYQVNDFEAWFTFDYQINGEPFSLVAEPGSFKSNLWAGLDSTLTEQFRDVAKISFSKTMEDGDIYWITLVLPPSFFPLVIILCMPLIHSGCMVVRI